MDPSQQGGDMGGGMQAAGNYPNEPAQNQYLQQGGGNPNQAGGGGGGGGDQGQQSDSSIPHDDR